MTSTPEHQVQQLLDAALDRTREALRRELMELIGRLRQETEAAREEAAHLTRADADSAAAALAAEALAAEHGAAGERLQAAVEEERSRHEQELAALRGELVRSSAAAVDLVERRAEADLAAAVAFARTDERQAELAASASLVDAVRALDAAPSLSAILDALAAAAARHAPRTALLVVKGGELRGWRWSGFDPSLGDPSALRLAASDETLAGRALRTGLMQNGSGPTTVGAPLAPTSAARAAVAIPVTVDEDVVAVLYADDNEGDRREVPSAWPELLEVMARHAGRCLESMTARRLPEWLRPAPRESASTQQDEVSAQRYARLLVSEIRLYNEPDLEAGRRAGDILHRLRPHIVRARELYMERVPERIRARTDYFDQELVRTLAGGDAALLGLPS